MKNSKFLIALFILSGFGFLGNAQMENREIMKISYETSNVSDFIINTLKTQVKDPDQYSKILNQVSKAKTYHTLYVNTKTKESIFVLDSTVEPKTVKTVGNVMYTFKNSKDEIFGKENFMGKEFSFKGNSKDLDWEISNETKEINGFESRKAILTENPDIYVWFTTDIAANVGPYLFFGLPGLVLESNGFFQSMNATTITNEKDVNIINQKLIEFDNEMKQANTLSMKEVILKKENFKRLAENGKK